MSAPEAWVKCDACTNGRLHSYHGGGPIEDVDPCPDCSDGLVPSDGEIEAAAKAIWLYTHSEGEWPPTWGGGRLADEVRNEARAALVAARRYQRKAEEQ